MGGLVMAGIVALLYWLQSRHPAPATPVEALEQEMKSKGLRPGQDFAVIVREGRKPKVWIKPEGRKRLRQIQNRKKKFHVFDA